MYTFKPKEELMWFMVVAGVTVTVQILTNFDPETITDWRTWSIASAAAVARAVLGASLAYFAKHGITYDADNK